MSLFKANFSSEIKTLPSAGKKISGVLAAGKTEITLTDEVIKSNSNLDVVYTSIYGVPVRSANFEVGSITLTFPAQTEDMTVMAVVDSTIANGKDGEDGKDGENGKDGVDGKDGIDGEPGAPGADGEDGKSAYQYAQDGGYTGTEEEFIDLLVNGTPDVVKTTDVVNNLTSTNTDLPLSAYQGKRLFDYMKDFLKNVSRASYVYHGQASVSSGKTSKYYYPSAVHLPDHSYIYITLEVPYDDSYSANDTKNAIIYEYEFNSAKLSSTVETRTEWACVGNGTYDQWQFTINYNWNYIEITNLRTRIGDNGTYTNVSSGTMRVYSRVDWYISSLSSLI